MSNILSFVKVSWLRFIVYGLLLILLICGTLYYFQYRNAQDIALKIETQKLQEEDNNFQVVLQEYRVRRFRLIELENNGLQDLEAESLLDNIGKLIFIEKKYPEAIASLAQVDVQLNAAELKYNEEKKLKEGGSELVSNTNQLNLEFVLPVRLPHKLLLK